MDLTSTVAEHYNNLQEAGLEERTKSRIFYQRNFHNWIKSIAIGDVLERIKKSNVKDIKVLDLCAGKGGDLLKWKKGGINALFCADIAATSMEQCEVRYKEMVSRSANERYQEKLFNAEFITADCTKNRLRDLYSSESVEFDLCSCQFSFHYCFESLKQAEMMIANACECLKPGGYFIGTTPNSCELVRRLRESEDLSFGNEVYKVTFDSDTDKNNLRLFGAKYNFDLDESVHCPEFLVYFPLLEKLAEKYNMKLVYRKTFADFVKENLESSENRELAKRMQAFEMYPPEDGCDLMCRDREAYSAADSFIEERKRKLASEANNETESPCVNVGTLSKPEWEASALYLVFAFQRQPYGKEEDKKLRDDEKPLQRKRKQDTTNESEGVSPKKAKY